MNLAVVIKKLVVITFLLSLFWLSPNTVAQASPEDSIFDCFESGKDCEKVETPAVDEKPVETTKGLSAWDYIKTLFALIFVIGLLFGLLKYFNKRNRTYDKNRMMKNMGGIALGQNKSIQLVVVGDTHYLIGVGEDIRLLKEITDPEELENLRSFYKESQVDGTSGLLEQLLTKLTKAKKTNPYHSDEDKDKDFSQLFNSKLGEMKEDRQRQINRLTEKERNKDD
ncbi:flagellar biosynthetic protein FliO [Sporosarcina sp. CAU 1771]